MSKYKVGDKVRILHTDYPRSGLTVGSVHEVAEVVNGYVKLPDFLPSGAAYNFSFYPIEVEPYTEDNTAKIARLVRELNSAMNDADFSIDIHIYQWKDSRGNITPAIKVSKMETIL